MTVAAGAPTMLPSKTRSHPGTWREGNDQQEQLRGQELPAAPAALGPCRTERRARRYRFPRLSVTQHRTRNCLSRDLPRGASGARAGAASGNLRVPRSAQLRGTTGSATPSASTRGEHAEAGDTRQVRGWRSPRSPRRSEVPPLRAEHMVGNGWEVAPQGAAQTPEQVPRRVKERLPLTMEPPRAHDWS